MLPKNSRYNLRRIIKMGRLRLALLFAFGLFLILFGLATLLWVPRVSTYSIVMTGGNPLLNRHKVVSYIKRHGDELNLDVDIIACEGTPKAISLVQEKKVDLALVNGLLHLPHADNVRQVATLTVEPVHLLVKAEYATKISENYANLNGLTVDAGPPEAEATYLSAAILRFLRIKSGDNGVKLTDFGIDKMFAMLAKIDAAKPENKTALRSELPDAFFHETTLPSPLMEQMIRIGGYKLVPLPFAKAFSQITVEEEDLDQDHIDQIHVESAVIPAYSYGGNPPEPAEACQTLGAPLIVIAHKDVPNEVISRLLPKMYTGPIGRLFDPPELKNVTPIYPFHPASLAFRDRDQPIVRADVMDFIRQLLSVIAPIIGGCLALYSYYRWRQTLRFLDYFRQLQRLDLVTKGFLVDPKLPKEESARVQYLETELETLQRKAIDEFCRNYFYREGVLFNFLSVLAETRDYLRNPNGQIGQETITTTSPPKLAEGVSK